MVNLRRNLIVRFDLQIRLIAYNCVTLVIGSFLTLIQLRISERLMQRGNTDLASAFLIFGLLVIVAGWLTLGLYISNRIFGPIHRLQLALQQLKNDQPAQPIHLRPGDYLGDVIEDFNQVLAQRNPDSKSDSKPK